MRLLRSCLVAGLFAGLALLTACSSGHSSPSASSDRSLIKAVGSAPPCAGLVGKPLPAVARDYGCTVKEAGDRVNDRVSAIYTCYGRELVVFPGEKNETAYWAWRDGVVVSGTWQQQDALAGNC